MLMHQNRDYTGPFHLWTRAPAASCIRLKDGRLHVYEPGDFPELLVGPEHIVVSRSLSNALRAACGSSTQILPAEIINVSTGEHLARDRFEIRPHEAVTPETIQAVDATGSRAWHFRHSHLFVTREVVLHLQQAGFKSLEFYPGFSAFIGGTRRFVEAGAVNATPPSPPVIAR